MKTDQKLPTLWYGTPDAPAPTGIVESGEHVSLTIAVKPVTFANEVNIYYRIDKRPERILRAFLARTDRTRDIQYFRATFPFIPAGSTVGYHAQLTRVGEVVKPSVSVPTSFQVQPPPATHEQVQKPALDGNRPSFELETEYIAHAHIEIETQPEIIGTTPDGLHIDFYVKAGTLRGPNVNARFERHGGDWMRIRPDGIGVCDIMATLLTTDGHRILASYSGVLDLGEHAYENAANGIYPPRPQAVVTPKFLSHGEKYAWLNRLQCFGAGFFDTREYILHYDMYTVRTKRTQDKGEP